MKTWQDVLAVKIEEMNVKDPWALLEDDSLQVQNCRHGWKEFVQHRALGRFQCSKCFHKWSSAKVHILFHMCWCQDSGIVRMRIFRQKCRSCPNPQMHEPEFSLETMETIVHNLVIKILQYFYKKPVQPSDLLEVVVDTPVRGPHDRAHCEACQLGICNSSRQAPALDAWKPLTDEDKAGMHSTKSWLPWASDVWESLKTVGEARTDRTGLHSSLKSCLRSDDCKPLISVGKARPHRTDLQPVRAGVSRNAHMFRISQTLKHQGSRPDAASTHHPSPPNSNFSWKWCCWISSSLLCVCALIIFLVLYFTMM